MLSAISGPDPRSPISLQETGLSFARPLARDFKGTHIAWSADLGGLPVEPEVAEALKAQRRAFADLGCVVEDATPDLRDADEIFQVMRAWNFELSYGHLLKSKRGLMKDTVIWNIEEGARLTGPQVGAAESKRTQLFHRVREFMDHYDFLVAPVAQVLPFDVNVPYVTEINGISMESYIDWMRSCYYITVTGSPAISVRAASAAPPAGRPADRRPPSDDLAFADCPRVRAGDRVLETQAGSCAILNDFLSKERAMIPGFSAVRILCAVPAFLASILCAFALAQDPSPPSRDRVYLRDIEGTWVNEQYLRVLTALRAPHAAAKKTPPVVIAIMREGRAIPIVVTDFNKASIQTVLDIEPDAKPGSYRLVVGASDRPMTSEEVKYVYFQGTRMRRAGSTGCALRRSS
jgi:hypothetical protein